MTPDIYGQRKPIVIGTIESNYRNWEQLKDNPYFLLASFVKYEDVWEVLNVDSAHLDNLNFNVFSNAKIVGQIKTKLDTVMERMAYVSNSYKILSKKIPHIGKKSEKFSGWLDTKIYRPLVTSTMNFNSRHHKILYRQLTKNDSLKIISFPLLLSEATGINSETSKFLSSKILHIMLPTKPVAPTTATFIFLNLCANVSAIVLEWKDESNFRLAWG